jgi:enamine deaminase RidA (YjgF/YER057c/UK114 family)
MHVEAKLQELGLELPPTPRPAANYVGAVQTGNLLFVSGHGPTQDGKIVYVGKVGKDLSIEEGYEAARLVALNCLASAKSVIGDLDRITRVVKILGMVNCSEDFGDQPKVINGASDLLVQLFGDLGPTVWHRRRDRDDLGGRIGSAISLPPNPVLTVG